MFREAGMQVSPVTMSCPSPWLSPEGGRGAFAFCFFGFCFCLLGIYFGLLALGGFLPLNIGKKLLLWAFCCGKILEGKRIIEMKMLKGG
jgi:hypothetical protein